MLKSTKFYLSALVAVSTVSLAARPAFAQVEEPDQSDVEVMEIVLNAPEAGPGSEGSLEGDISVAFAGLPLPRPGMDIAAMRRGGPGGPGGGWGHRGGPCPALMLEGENAITDDQYEKLYELKNRTLDQMGQKVLDLKTAERHLRDTLSQENIDEKAAKKLQSQIISLKSDIEGIKLDSKLSMMQIFTAAQRKEMRKSMIQGVGRKGRCGEGGHHMMMKKFMERKEGP